MEYSEQELIRRAKQGEHAAMEQIFRMHLDSAIRLAYLVTRNWATAEDAVQEAFVQAFRSLPGFQANRPFKPWFTRIVINKAKRTKSRLDREHLPYELEEENPHASFNPEGSALERESLDQLFAAINELDDKHRLPLLLKYVSEFTEAEIAEALRLPLSTVKSRLYTARQRLKRNLAAREGGGSDDPR
ncbi:MAG TPA: RNA polymerase sigma factor [Limnochordia bacterium]|nr:RNA polymerase sigma factor [Limnochordia bacterium]